MNTDKTTKDNGNLSIFSVRQSLRLLLKIILWTMYVALTITIIIPLILMLIDGKFIWNEDIPELLMEL